MSVAIATVTVPAGSATVQLFEPLTAAAQLSLSMDDYAFLGAAAGIFPTVSPIPMPTNTAPVPPNWTQLSLGVGDTIYIAPYPGESDLHVSYILTS